MKQIKIASSYKNYNYNITIYSPLASSTICDAFYFLDGQNAFFDKFATYHKSLKAMSVLNKLKRPYIAVAIDSPNDERRFSIYTPFKLESLGINNDLNFYLAFKTDLINTIIPKCEKNLDIKRRYLVASSLATLPALDVSNYFTGLALFSSAFFLDYSHTLKLIKNHNAFNFIAVGQQEFSDGTYTKDDYLKASKWYYTECLKHKISAKLFIWKKGKHDEISWRDRKSVV